MTRLQYIYIYNTYNGTCIHGIPLMVYIPLMVAPWLANMHSRIYLHIIQIQTQTYMN